MMDGFATRMTLSGVRKCDDSALKIHLFERRRAAPKNVSASRTDPNPLSRCHHTLCHEKHAINVEESPAVDGSSVEMLRMQ
jgi:hypothetical protein